MVVASALVHDFWRVFLTILAFRILLHSPIEIEYDSKNATFRQKDEKAIWEKEKNAKYL